MDVYGQKAGNAQQPELRVNVLQSFMPIQMTRSRLQLILTGCGPMHLIFPAIPPVVTIPVDFIEDRKSRPGRHLYPQYKLFLNNPDSIAFPTGVLGKLTQ